MIAIERLELVKRSIYRLEILNRKIRPLNMILNINCTKDPKLVELFNHLAPNEIHNTIFFTCTTKISIFITNFFATELGQIYFFTFIFTTRILLQGILEPAFNVERSHWVVIWMSVFLTYFCTFSWSLVAIVWEAQHGSTLSPTAASKIMKNFMTKEVDLALF